MILMRTRGIVFGPDSRAGRQALVHGRVVGAGNPAFFYVHFLMRTATVSTASLMLAAMPPTALIGLAPVERTTICCLHAANAIALLHCLTLPDGGMIFASVSQSFQGRQ